MQLIMLCNFEGLNLFPINRTNTSIATPNHKKNFWKDFDLERLFRFVSETFVPHPQVSFLK